MKTEILPRPIRNLPARQPRAVEHREPRERRQPRPPRNRARLPLPQRGGDLRGIEDRGRWRVRPAARRIALQVVKHRRDLAHVFRQRREVPQPRPVRERGDRDARDRPADFTERRGVVAEQPIRAVEVELHLAVACRDGLQLFHEPGQRRRGKGRACVAREPHDRHDVQRGRDGGERERRGFPPPATAAQLHFADTPKQRPHLLPRQLRIFFGTQRRGAMPHPK